MNYPTAEHSIDIGTSAAAVAVDPIEQSVSISNSIITSSTINTNTTAPQLQSSNDDPASVTQAPTQHESIQTTSSAGSMHVSTVTSTVTSSTSAVLVPTVEPSKAAAV